MLNRANVAANVVVMVSHRWETRRSSDSTELKDWQILGKTVKTKSAVKTAVT